jgi:hypothetical protein
MLGTYAGRRKVHYGFHCLARSGVDADDASLFRVCDDISQWLA